MSDHYILDGHKAIPADALTWAKWLENNYAKRHVADEMIEGVRISTVFLGLDHAYNDGPPMIFETMIFGGKLDQYQDRCSTWEEAEAMHAKAVREVAQVEDKTG